MRKSHVFLVIVAVELLMMVLVPLYSLYVQRSVPAALAECTALVRGLGLTDLCLFSEASYTRNPTQTDLHTPFQDHPLSIEHFPSGSLLPPPAMLHSKRRGSHG